MQQAARFHPAVAAWFDAHFDAPTPSQARAWPAIQQGRNVLVAAPTGSGKTLAAFLAAIDALVRQGTAQQDRARQQFASAGYSGPGRRDAEPAASAAAPETGRR